MTQHPQWTIDPEVKVHCKDCTAECCKHIGIPIDAPQTWDDFQRIKHYVSHEGVSCYLDVEGDWIVEFLTKCGQLDGNRCKAWGTKEYPGICAEYEMRTCVMNEEGEWWEILFRTPADVDEHCRKQGLHGPALAQHIPCVSVPIDTPEDLKDFDDIRWYVAHRDVMVYRKADAWYVHLNSMCKQSCLFHNSHIVRSSEADIILATWEDIYSYCEEHRIPMPAEATGKLALRLTESGNR